MAFLHPLFGTCGCHRHRDRCHDWQGLQLTEQAGAGFDSLEQSAAVCSEVARHGLGRYAYALHFLPAAEKSRIESLTAIVRGLFDFAREPGFAAERLAKILLWQDQLDEALETGHADEPIFAVFACEDRKQSWNRPALEHLETMVRALALARDEPMPLDLSQTLWTLTLGERPGASSIEFLACLLRGEPVVGTSVEITAELPASWHQAVRYSTLASRGSEPGRLRRALISFRTRL